MSWNGAQLWNIHQNLLFTSVFFFFFNFSKLCCTHLHENWVCSSETSQCGIGVNTPCHTFSLIHGMVHHHLNRVIVSGTWKWQKCQVKQSNIGKCQNMLALSNKTLDKQCKCRWDETWLSLTPNIVNGGCWKERLKARSVRFKCVVGMQVFKRC